MNPTFKVQEVAGGIWQIGTPLGSVYVNCYLVDMRDGWLLYDTGLVSTAEAVIHLLQHLHASPGDLKTILISHSHHDHIGANAEIAEATGATLLAHELARPWMVDHQRQFREFFEVFAPIFPISESLKNFFFNNLGRPWFADQWLREFPLDLPFARQGRVLSTPGHSPDSVTLWLPQEKIAICGDAFMGAGVGGGLPQYADKSAYRQSLKQLLELKPNFLLSGHFDPLSGKRMVAALEQSLRLIDYLDEFIRKAFEKTPEGFALRFLAE
ncbi:MAG: MBL fold metallo-hydrolase, partial [Calditrichaeota bacterium]